MSVGWPLASWSSHADAPLHTYPSAQEEVQLQLNDEHAWSTPAAAPLPSAQQLTAGATSCRTQLDLEQLRLTFKETDAKAKCTGLIVALHSASVQLFASELIAVVLFGALVRLTQLSPRDAKVLIGQICAAPLPDKQPPFDKGNLQALYNKWSLVKALMRDEEDDLFWIGAAISCKSLSQAKLRRLISGSVQPTWKHLTPQAKRDRWSELLTSSNSAAHLQQLSEASASNTSSSSSDSSSNGTAISSVSNGSVEEETSMEEEEKAAADAEEEVSKQVCLESVGLLKQWHRATRMMLQKAQSSCWKQLHSSGLAAAHTAESLLIAMEAVSRWKFYTDKVSCANLAHMQMLFILLLFGSSSCLCGIIVCAACLRCGFDGFVAAAG
jgi:hypothetical protein